VSCGAACWPVRTQTYGALPDTPAGGEKSCGKGSRVGTENTIVRGCLGFGRAFGSLAADTRLRLARLISSADAALRTDTGVVVNVSEM
jgi:hypothetical protein